MRWLWKPAGGLAANDQGAHPRPPESHGEGISFVLKLAGRGRGGQALAVLGPRNGRLGTEQ
jgi:hypothetical protein